MVDAFHSAMPVQLTLCACAGDIPAASNKPHSNSLVSRMFMSVFSRYLVDKGGGGRGCAGRSHDAPRYRCGAWIPSGKNDKGAAMLRSREVRCMHVQRYRAWPTVVRPYPGVKFPISENAATVTLRKMLSCTEVRLLPQSCRAGRCARRLSAHALSRLAAAYS
jgi:hypothetical protein